MSEPVSDRPFLSRVLPRVLPRLVVSLAIAIPLGCAMGRDLDSKTSTSPSAPVPVLNSFWTAPLGAKFESLAGTWVHLEEFGVYPNPRGRECYAREEDGLSILGFAVEEIVYCVFDDRLVSVSAECFECDHARDLFRETCLRISARAEELSQAEGYSMQTCESGSESAATEPAPGADPIDTATFLAPATGAGALYVRTPDGEAVTLSRRHHSLSVVMDRGRDAPKPPEDETEDER